MQNSIRFLDFKGQTVVQKLPEGNVKISNRRRFNKTLDFNGDLFALPFRSNQFLRTQVDS